MDAHQPTKTSAEQEGQAACRLGVPVEHNPYEAGTNEYDAWEQGWDCEAAKLASGK